MQNLCVCCCFLERSICTWGSHNVVLLIALAANQMRLARSRESPALQKQPKTLTLTNSRAFYRPCMLGCKTKCIAYICHMTLYSSDVAIRVSSLFLFASKLAAFEKLSCTASSWSHTGRCLAILAPTDDLKQSAKLDMIGVD